MTEPDKTNGTPGGTGVPMWPAPHRITRILQGRPSVPVPWVLVSAGRAWAWDPTAGLLALDDLGTESSMFLPWGCLSPDGRLLNYSFRNASGSRPLGYSEAAYRLESGERTTQPLGKEDERVFSGAHGHTLTAQYTDYVEGYAQSCRYLLEDGSGQHELPLTDLLGYNLDGPAAQFSANGDELAVSHVRLHSPDLWISITDLATGAVARFEGFGLASCAAWAPSGTRLIVQRMGTGYAEVFDRGSGAFLSLKPLLKPIETPNGQRPYVSGWLDDTHILATRVQGRRLLVWVIDVDNGDHWQLLDLPLPTSQLEFYGLMLASAAAQADPSRVGYLGPEPD